MAAGVLHVLVVEDEVFIAEDLAWELGDLGAQPTVAYSVADALTLPLARFDAAILDVTLGDGRSWPVAKRLSALGVPFSFRTSTPSIPLRLFPDAPAFDKFSSASDALEALELMQSSEFAPRTAVG